MHERPSTKARNPITIPRGFAKDRGFGPGLSYLHGLEVNDVADRLALMELKPAVALRVFGLVKEPNVPNEGRRRQRNFGRPTTT